MSSLLLVCVCLCLWEWFCARIPIPLIDCAACADFGASSSIFCFYRDANRTSLALWTRTRSVHCYFFLPLHCTHALFSKWDWPLASVWFASQHANKFHGMCMQAMEHIALAFWILSSYHKLALVLGANALHVAAAAEQLYRSLDYARQLLAWHFAGATVNEWTIIIIIMRRRWLHFLVKVQSR